MAVHHFAYTFDAVAFARPFCAAENDGAGAALAKLQERAREALRRPGATFQEALVAVRYDSGWLDDDSQEADQNAKRFVLCLLAESVAAPSLGRRGEPLHHVVLKALLPDAGWTAEEIDRLLRGDALESLLHHAGLGTLAPLLSGINDLGGWLGHEGNKSLKAKLAKAEGYFDWEGQRHKTILAEIVPAWEPQAEAMAKQAFQRAQAMLNEVNDPRRALFLILD